MDPNATLAEMLFTANAILNSTADDRPDQARQLGDRLAELVVGMDDWMSHAGALPMAWAR